MNDSSEIVQFRDAIVELELENAKRICQTMVDKGTSPFDIIQNGITPALITVGYKFEAEEYFLPELIMAGEIMNQITMQLNPYIKKENPQKTIGKVIIGTAKTDIHDIGKGIVKTFLEAEGFEVIDLGVDVSTEQFIKAIEEENPDILAISTLLSSSMVEIQKLPKDLEVAKLRDKVKIIIGGAPITKEFVKDIGADGFAENAIQGVKLCKRWVEK